ncbi:MAG: hypothetical protein V3U28_10275, partial [Candidatus Acidoferrales bacterium]
APVEPCAANTSAPTSKPARPSRKFLMFSTVSLDAEKLPAAAKALRRWALAEAIAPRALSF